MAKRGRPAKRPDGFSEFERSEMLRAWKAGVKVFQLAAYFGCTGNLISRELMTFPEYLSLRPEPGEKYSPKTLQMAREVLRMDQRKVMTKDIAKAMGVKSTRVSQLRKVYRELGL